MSTAPSANNNRREIGDEAIWTLSSAKSGNGVDQIRDDNTSTFWQTDGTQPHYLYIQFLKKVRIQEIAMYLDFKADESYTPNKISIRAGLNLQDLKEISYIELKDPIGWYIFPLKTKQLNGVEKINIAVKIHISDKLRYLGQERLAFPEFKSYEVTQFAGIR